MRKALYFILLSFCSVISACGQTREKEPVSIPYDSLRFVLEDIHKTDQAVRQGFNEVREEDKNAFFQKMIQIDSVNQIQVQKILQQYGWLPQSKIGQEAADGLFLVVQHAPSSVIEKYLPELQKMAQKGEASKTAAAMMEDRLLMYQGKKQIYGTQATSMNREDGSSGIWPIADSKNVNARRKAVGFRETIEEYALLLNATYIPTEELLLKGRKVH